jgi:hypothetical protein
MISSARSSDLQTASAIIAKGTNRINSVSLLGDNVNVSTVTLYDNPNGTATGKVLAKVVARTSDAQNHIIFTNPIFAETGISAVLTGTGGNYIVYFGA